MLQWDHDVIMTQPTESRMGDDNRKYSCYKTIGSAAFNSIYMVGG